MMNRNSSLRGTLLAGTVAAMAVCGAPHATAQLNSGQPQILSTNQTATPLAPRDARYEPLNPNLADAPDYTVGQAVTTVVSPDKKTLLILTTGFNQLYYLSGSNGGNPIPDDSTEWIFVFDISTPTPIQKQAIPVPNTYCGVAFNPSGTEFYASGGDNDNVHIYDLVSGSWTETATPVALNHTPTGGVSAGGLGVATSPEAAGLAVSANGKTIVVANYENDSISILGNSGSGWTKTGEYDLRPGKENAANAGVPGGEYPFWVQIVGNSTAYVSSVRDREVDVVNISGSPSVIARIKVSGSPNKEALSPAQTHLYVAEDNSDSVAVIDTGTNTLLGEIKVTAPAGVFPNTEGFKGAQPNSVTVSADGTTLYVTNAGENAVAVVKSPTTPATSYVAGLIPTGFYPNSVSLSGDGTRLYIVNGKSATGPNPLNVSNAYGGTSNQYDLQLTKAGFQELPVPTTAELSALTTQVLTNDNFFQTPTSAQQATMAFLHSKIHHVIYVIKENRTYDQVLGDLPVGDGDPNITQFGQAITPNFHAIASNFVDFDNFYDVSDVSGDGWPWSTSARTTDTIEKEIPANYAGRGLDNNSEGTNRNVNVGIGNTLARAEANPLDGTDPDALPGTANVAAPDSADGDEGEGYLWNSLLKQPGKTVRDYGMFLDITRYNLAAVPALSIPEVPYPHAVGLQVAYSTNPALAPYTDPYYRGFDNTFPDFFRFEEWRREFTQFEANGNLPTLSLVRLMHDHTGNFGIAINGVNTVELQEADNDFAVGSLIEAVAGSRYHSDTLICVIEDDAQDGGDHVDAHRSTFYMVGPYVKQGVVDSTRYNTVSVLRTIEDVLGIAHLNLNDEHALPMADAFDPTITDWTYRATPSAYLASTTLPIPPSLFAASAPMKSLHDGKWWAEHTKGFDFSVEDHLDTAKYNRVVWEGTMGDKPYPTERSGKNLRLNRAELLKSFYAQQHPATTDSAQDAAAAAATKPGN